MAAKRTARETWEAIEKGAVEDEMDRILALSNEDLAKELKDEGLEDAFRGETAAETVEKLFAWRERRKQHLEGASRLARARERFDAKVAAAKYAGLPRAELLQRIEVARVDARSGQRATVLFRNKNLEAATEDELRELLEELDALGDDE